MNLHVVRPTERRDTFAAFAFLTIFIGSHSMLEAARDALFLANVPTARLPWVYVAIAVCSLAAARTEEFLHRVTPRTTLVVFAAVAGVGTLVLAEVAPLLGDAGMYVLYVWSGVLVTLVLIHFWSLLGDLFSVIEAKRLYGLISVGAIVGALGGTGFVTALGRGVPARFFVVISGFGFLLSAAMPLLFTAPGTRTVPKARPAPGFLAQGRYVFRTRYVRRIVLIGLFVTVAVTCSDFVFKSVVATHYAPEELAHAFGAIYFGLNVASLFVQLVIGAFLLRKLPLPWVATLLPLGLALGSAGLVITGGLAAALVTKGLDGSMRYSLHRTSLELLLVPLSESARRAVKTFLEVFGQRGAQLVASVVILVAMAVSLPPRSVAVVVFVASLAAVIAAIRLRRDYVHLFRHFVARNRRRLGEAFPDLDLPSLETLLASLDSESDEEVLTAFRILEREHKIGVVPGLILYHPSERVVVTALRSFAHRGRKISAHAMDHLDRHPSARIRAEAVAARAVLDPQPDVLRVRLAIEREPLVRAAIVASMAVLSMLPEGDARAALTDIAEGRDTQSKILVAELIGWRSARKFGDLLAVLARDPDPAVRKVAISAIGALGGEDAAAMLIALLGDAAVVAEVRAAIVEIGEEASAPLRNALVSRATPRDVRRQIPALFAQCNPDHAAVVLLANLSRETDGMTRYRTILALQHIVEHRPLVRLDPKLLSAEIRQTVRRAYRCLERRIILERGAAESPLRVTAGHALLVALLHDKERNAVGRLFRLLALRYPRHDFTAIYESIESGRKDHKANAIELIGNIVKDPLRSAVVGLVDDAEDGERLEQCGEFHMRTNVGYDELVEQLVGSHSIVERDVAIYHVGELGLRRLAPVIQALRPVTSDVERTLAILLGSVRGGGTRAPIREGRVANAR